MFQDSLNALADLDPPRPRRLVAFTREGKPFALYCRNTGQVYLRFKLPPQRVHQRVERALARLRSDPLARRMVSDRE